MNPKIVTQKSWVYSMKLKKENKRFDLYIVTEPKTTVQH
jgi:hypothetical protein